MRSQSDPDAFSQLIMSGGREYQCLVYERSSPHKSWKESLGRNEASKIKIPHKSWNNRPTFNMDLNSNTGYNNQEYTNAGGKVYVG